MKENHITKRLRKIRERIKEEEVEGVFITNPVNGRYLSGFTGTRVYLLIMQEDAFLLTDFRYRDQALEEAPHYSLVSLKGSLADSLKEIVDKKNIKSLAFEKQHLTLYWYDLLKEKLPPKIRLLPLYNLVENIRQIKDEEEIALLKEGAALTERCFTGILPYIKPGVREEEVACELEYLCRKGGGQKTAFDFIVASGRRSALPHGVASWKKIEPGDMVVIDFGIYYKGYCSDMTRTLAMGYAGSREKKLYSLVLKAQQEAVQGIEEGMSGEEADNLARKVLAEAGYGDNFGHGLGHGIGLEVHEEPRLAPKIKSTLQRGMVFSVEPGIYLTGWGGIRIEDMALLREGGCELLTGNFKEELLVL